MENLHELINELIKYPKETPWLEFKHNNYDPDMIGKDISALANAAALYERSCAYMIWGIDDEKHEIVGTEKNLQDLKRGNQEIENWLHSLLSKNTNFEYHCTKMNNKLVGVLIIYKAINYPVMFKKIDYIRVGSYTKTLNEHTEIQRQLWEKLRDSTFEEQIAKPNLSISDALNLISYSTYFNLKNENIPSDEEKIMHYMLEEGIIIKQDDGMYSITNLGAILFAKRLDDFGRISRKAIRVVKYENNNKLQILKDYIGVKGYAVGFEGLIEFLTALLPSKEVIDGAIRKTEMLYPIIALREAIANALIHQDFSISGAGPIVEIFQSRIEITNPGTPLVDIMRIIDNPPKSRNEKLASLMRRLKMCEELGSGWDRMVISCELQQLPAPKIRLYEESTKVIICAEIPFSNISPEDKLWSCYLHACIKWVSNDGITNSSIRERFGLGNTASASVSRLIKDAIEQKLIKPLDPDTAPRYMKYVPIWA